MQRYQGGDVRAFEALYRRHKDPLYRYLLRGCGDRDIAAELFQDTWARLIRARGDWQPRGRFAAWLYRLAHNRLMDHFRLARLATQPLDEANDPPADDRAQPERLAQAAQQGRRILQALALLPAEQRTAFLLKEEGGLTLEEIAAVTEVGRETVKSRLRYALAKLRQELADV